MLYGSANGFSRSNVTLPIITSRKGNVLISKVHEYDSGDARCCPSLVREDSYKVVDGKLDLVVSKTTKQE